LLIRYIGLYFKTILSTVAMEKYIYNYLRRQLIDQVDNISHFENDNKDKSIDFHKHNRH
jgi:hypothetical protein